jgi:hypothetical protein
MATRKKFVFTKARRAALKKAQAANRRRVRAKYGTTSKRYIAKTSKANKRLRRSMRRAARGGYKARKVTQHSRMLDAFAARARGEDSGDYSAYTLDNPFRRGRVRATASRTAGKRIKVRGRYYMIMRLRSGRMVARPWRKTARR